MTNRLVVVGGGVLGTMHAVEALAAGWEVVQIEREDAPRGASVRNFGLVWVSGRAAGPELDLALRARAKWEEIAARCPGTGFRANGSLTVVRRPEELAVLEQVVARPDAAARGLRLLEPAEAVATNPALGGLGWDRAADPVLAALHCANDAAVEPRRVLGALRDGCLATGRYRWLPGREATGVADHQVVDGLGERHRGDLVVLCPGAAHRGLVAEVLDRAPLRRVRLQMLETEPYRLAAATSLADGDSLRYYPAFDVPAGAALGAQKPAAADWAAQLLVVQRSDGSLTVGDTHAYDEPFPFDVDEAPYRHLLSVAGGLLAEPLPPVARRWAGVYSQLVPTAGVGPVYFRAEVTAGVQVVTGPGGRGMTLSPAIAEETFR
ncbi:MAG TPA: TIGR03364 family FAD-dependent oxidoreductase [Acidimicrobiales bacterium]|jgi:FAD dependent oxidoreductase TIGR03364|nr:TIGR03364 family FAD-dependent oxidoreductase [Acidimicrobiales bacterium]